MAGWAPYGRQTPMFNWSGKSVAAKLVAVHDSDTCRVVFDTGEHGVRQFIVRVAGIDGPEIVTHDPVERQHAVSARNRFLELAAPGVFATTGDYTAKDIEALLHRNEVVVTLRTGDYDKYGRLLATVVASDGTDIGAKLVAEGLAHAYYGKTKQPWHWLCP